MTLIGFYKNGNTQVNIYDDGTKVRLTEDTEFRPLFPESIDVKITNQCDMGCAFCHENSTPEGHHGSLVHDGHFVQLWMHDLHAYTELAIGGGNPLAHPQLTEFLFMLRQRRIFANLTVNYNHFVQAQKYLLQAQEDYLFRGIGVSINSDYEPNFKLIERFPNAVLHLIAGLDSMEFINTIPKSCKVLFLGYKDFGRGKEFLANNSQIQKNMDDLKKALPNLGFQVVSLDNLAIEQLKPEEWLSEEDWQERYMGDDGTHTMYIDAVKQEYAVSSTSQVRYPITFLKKAFNHVKEVHNVSKS